LGPAGFELSLFILGRPAVMRCHAEVNSYMFKLCPNRGLITLIARHSNVAPTGRWAEVAS
jgi:hypothetical protein